MTRTVVCLLLLGVSTLTAGIAMVHVPAGLIALGILAIVAGVLMIERPTDGESRR